MSAIPSEKIVVTTNSNIDLSILSLISSSDIVGKLVIFLLFCASIMTWAIIIHKLIFYSSIKQRMYSFEKMFWSEKTLDELYKIVKGSINNPLSAVFIAAINSCKKDRNSDNETQGAILKIGKKERMMSAMNLAKNRAIEQFDKFLNFLATVGSSAPFIGLFGTVWGIMHSFQSIAASKNTSLAVVAPGIAEALFATALGLFVAIPASVFYNYLTTKIMDIENMIDHFSNELYSLLSRAIDEGKI